MTTATKATFRMGGEKLTFWQFVGSILIAYGLAVVLLLLGPLGLVLSALVGYSTTLFLVAGIVVFSLQRPGRALIVVAVGIAIHYCLVYYWDVRPGALWILTPDGANYISHMTGIGD